MNDRFRFRVWDIKNNRYAQFIYENFYEYLTMPNRCVVEQCTGLKDKNGNLIYEGDIVESTIATRKNKPARDVVKYDNEFAGFDPMCCYDCDCGIYNPADELVVIGNIHENPELIKEDK